MAQIFVFDLAQKSTSFPRLTRAGTQRGFTDEVVGLRVGYVHVFSASETASEAAISKPLG